MSGVTESKPLEKNGLDCYLVLTLILLACRSLEQILKERIMKEMEVNGKWDEV